MTKNRRYEAHYDDLNDRAIVRAAKDNAPITIGQNAFGPQKIEWAPNSARPQVWAWISWRDGPATRLPVVAAGWNDRVVIVEWEAPGGKRSVVVWRNAVTRRNAPPEP